MYKNGRLVVASSVLPHNAYEMLSGTFFTDLVSEDVLRQKCTHFEKLWWNYVHKYWTKRSSNVCTNVYWQMRSTLRRGMSLCPPRKPTIFGSFRGNTALPRNIFIACLPIVHTSEHHVLGCRMWLCRGTCSIVCTGLYVTVLHYTSVPTWRVHWSVLVVGDWQFKKFAFLRMLRCVRCFSPTSRNILLMAYGVAIIW